MADDKTKRDFRARDRLSGSEDYEVEYFAKKAGITVQQMAPPSSSCRNLGDGLVADSFIMPARSSSSADVPVPLPARTSHYRKRHRAKPPSRVQHGLCDDLDTLPTSSLNSSVLMPFSPVWIATETDAASRWFWEGPCGTIR